MSCWIEVCKEEKLLPGRMHHWEDDDWMVMVANVDGSLYAVQGNCTHRNVPLVQGILEGQTVMCCQHSYKFDVTTGAVFERNRSRGASAPSLGECAGKPLTEPKARPLWVYPVKVEDGAIWVEVPDPLP